MFGKIKYMIICITAESNHITGPQDTVSHNPTEETGNKTLRLATAVFQGVGNKSKRRYPSNEYPTAIFQ